MSNEKPVKMKSNAEAKDHFCREIETQWEGCEQWMGVLFRVKDGKIELAVRTTHNFPMNDCLAAIGMLCGNLHQEILNAGNQAPLANRPPPLPKYSRISDYKPPQSEVQKGCDEDECCGTEKTTSYRTIPPSGSVEACAEAITRTQSEVQKGCDENKECCKEPESKKSPLPFDKTVGEVSEAQYPVVGKWNEKKQCYEIDEGKPIEGSDDCAVKSHFSRPAPSIPSDPSEAPSREEDNGT